MKNREIAITWFIIILVSIAFYGYAIRGMFHECPKQKVIVLLPNQGQLQQILNAIELDKPLKVDHVIGPNSIGKWDRIAGNAYAAPYFTASGAPKEK